MTGLPSPSHLRNRRLRYVRYTCTVHTHAHSLLFENSDRHEGWNTVEPLCSGHHWGTEIILSFIEGCMALSQGLFSCTKRVHLGLCKVAFIDYIIGV